MEATETLKIKKIIKIQLYKMQVSKLYQNNKINKSF